jgi:hypothetical protein
MRAQVTFFVFTMAAAAALGLFASTFGYAAQGANGPFTLLSPSAESAPSILVLPVRGYRGGGGGHWSGHGGGTWHGGGWYGGRHFYRRHFYGGGFYVAPYYVEPYCDWVWDPDLGEWVCVNPY